MREKKYVRYLNFLIVLACFLCEKANAQQKENVSSGLVYFKGQNGSLWDRRQLDSFIHLRSNNRYRLIDRATSVEKKGDTLIYHFKLLLDAAPTDRNGRLLAGQQLPYFNFRDINDSTISLQKIKGKPVVINFWFSACEPCIQEMPALNQLKEKYKNSDVVFLSMTFESKKNVLDFLKKHIFNFKHIPGVKTYCDNITSIYPLTLFINRQGIIQSARHNMPSLYNYDTSKRLDQLDMATYEKEIEGIQSFN